MASETDQIKAQENSLDNLLEQGSKLLNVNQYAQLKLTIADYNQKMRIVAYRQAILRKINDLTFEAIQHKKKGFILALTDHEKFEWKRSRISRDSAASGELQPELYNYGEDRTLKQLFNSDPGILSYLNRFNYRTEIVDNMHIKVFIPPMDTLDFASNNSV